MRTFDVDFNRLARGGAVKVRLKDGDHLKLNERVLLVEADEDMELEAVLAEVEDGFAYFRIVERVAEANDVEIARAKLADVSPHFGVIDGNSVSRDFESIPGLFTIGLIETVPNDGNLKIKVSKQRTHGKFSLSRLTSGRS